MDPDGRNVVTAIFNFVWNTAKSILFKSVTKSKAVVNKVASKTTKHIDDSLNISLKRPTGKGEVGDALSDGKSFWSNTRHNTPVQNAYGHFKKHGKEFPEFKNAKQYVEGTKKFVTNPPKGTKIKTDKDGYKYFYNEQSNTFAVTKPDGTPMTMYKPTRGKDYFNDIK